MPALIKTFLGLTLAATLLAVPVAHASPPAQPVAKTFKQVQATNHPTVTATFRSKMADYVEGTGTREGHAADTPEMRIVPLDGSLIKTKLAATEINEHNIGGPGAEFAYHGAAKSTRFKLLIPVSGHYGLPYKQFASQNSYQVVVHDKSGKQIYSQVIKSGAFGKPVAEITRDDLVTEHDIELPFDAGKEFKVSFWPTATSKGGYVSGREVTVRLAE